MVLKSGQKGYNAARKKATKTFRTNMANNYKANPNRGKEKGLYSTTKVTGITKDDKSVLENQEIDGISYRRNAQGYTGVTLPDNKGTFDNLSNDQVMQLVKEYKNRKLTPQEQATADEERFRKEAEQEQLKKRITDEMNTPDVTPEELAQIGNLSPEQLAQLDALPKIKRGVTLKEILSNAGEQAVVGATGGATVGAIGGSVVGGVGAIPGAIGVGALGGAFGATRGVFTSFKKADIENVDDLKQVYDNAVYDMEQSISLNAQGELSDTESTQKFNEAYLQILKVQRQYKQLENRREWATDIKDKQVELQNYLDKVYPDRKNQLAISQQKPAPTFIDYGIDQKGNVIKNEQKN